jgi:hypothetical protein
MSFIGTAAQIARYAPDNSLIGVTSLNSDTVAALVAQNGRPLTPNVVAWS